jgi:peptidoglycan hydrolase CwlO-like protein
MKELLMGLLGGGVMVQLFNAIVSARPTQRQMNATALGSEVEALEKTINLLKDNLEAEIMRHAAERKELMERIEMLNGRIQELGKAIEVLREENHNLKNDLNRD